MYEVRVEKTSKFGAIMLLGIFYGPTKGPLNPWSLQSLVSSHFLKNTSWYLTIWASCQNIDTPIILVNRLWHFWRLEKNWHNKGRLSHETVRAAANFHDLWPEGFLEWCVGVPCCMSNQTAVRFSSASGFGCLVFLRVKLINWKQMLGQMKEYEMCAVQLLIGLWEVYCYWHISACAMTYNI